MVWQWASYSHLTSWSYKTPPLALWNFLHFVFMQACLATGWSFLLPFLFFVSAISWSLVTFLVTSGSTSPPFLHFFLWGDCSIVSVFCSWGALEESVDVKSAHGHHTLTGGPDVPSTNHPHCKCLYCPYSTARGTLLLSQHAGPIPGHCKSESGTIWYQRLLCLCLSHDAKLVSYKAEFK